MALEPIPLASQSYSLSSRPAAAHQLLNCYAEKLPEGSRSPFIIKPAPGLNLFQTVGTGPIYAMETVPGFLYVVSGGYFYRLHADGSPTENLGFIGVTDAPTIAVGSYQVVVVSPPNAYVANHSITALHQITTGAGNFPVDGASSVSYIDGYFAFTSMTGDYFFVSKLLDGNTFNSLDYATSERRPDYVQHGVAHNGELWLFGQDSSVVWYNAGAANFPLRERTGSVLEQGVGSSNTIVALDNSLFWLGTDRIIYRSQGYQARRISNHAIEEVLTRYGDLRDINACGFLFEGHAFYSITMPSVAGNGRTFIYDGATQMWHERSSAASGAGIWRVRTSVQFGPYLLLGDSANGNLYDVYPDMGTDNGVTIPRFMVLPPIITHGQRAFMSRLEIEMEVATAGAPGTVLLDWSNDGGLTFTAPRSLSTGVAGSFKARVATTRLGSFRQRVLRIRSSGRATIYGVDVDTHTGNV